MEDARQQLVEKLKTANNILVTVSRDPSVDQLAALLGLTLMLNKQGKHAAAVFSGEVPSTIEFLQPEETIEKNTNSLRDFIIALDKNKADKLRYKVEDDVVRIFITPYKTSITESDLDFSQGDFNVDLVIGIGVTQQEDIDEAITAHGRILHDATVASINLASPAQLGSINWSLPEASSLSEMVSSLIQDIGVTPDEQIATALLTGIVAETDRFSNQKTSAQTMNVSGVLMAAGANQQLVAAKLEENTGETADPDKPIHLRKDKGSNKHDKKDDGDKEDKNDDDQPKPSDDDSPDAGALDIKHGDEEKIPESEKELPSLELPTPDPEASPADEAPPEEEKSEPEANVTHMSAGSQLMTEPPTLGGTLTANSNQPRLDPANDALGVPTTEQPELLNRNSGPASPPAPRAPQPPVHTPTAPVGLTPPPPAWVPPQPPEPPAPASNNEQTLTHIEHSSDTSAPQLDPSALGAARDEVSRALSTNTADTPEAIQALNAQPMGTDLHPAAPPEPQQPQVIDHNAPPPVPPPIPFQFGNPPKQQ